MSDAFTGEIRIFAGKYAPVGWAFCDGSSLPVSSNPALYALIGNIWGGDTTKFNLPDYRSRLVVGAVTGSNPPAAPLTPHAIGATGGSEGVQLTEANMPAHTHALMASSKAADSSKLTANAALGSTTAPIVSYIPATTTVSKVLAFNGGTIQPSGGAGMAHENRMPITALNFIICLNGIFPQA